MSEKKNPHQMARPRKQRRGKEKNWHQRHQLRSQEEKVDLAWSCTTHEQVQATTCCVEMGTTGQKKEGEANGHLEEDHRGGDAGEDLDRDRLDGPRPGCLEETCWRPMLRPEPRGLSK